MLNTESRGWMNELSAVVDQEVEHLMVLGALHIDVPNTLWYQACVLTFSAMLMHVEENKACRCQRQMGWDRK